MMQEYQLPTSEHFQLQRVAAGIYAAVAIMGKGAESNASIIDLGERTLIFDTFNTPAAAQDLRAAARQLTGRIADVVVNSHWHGDHVHGNQVFAAEAMLVATAKTRQLVLTRAAAMLAHNQRRAPEVLPERAAQLAATTDAQQRQTLERAIADLRQMIAVLPTIRICPPTVTFDQRMTLHGSHRAVEVITLGGGHTDSDAFLWLPEERIAFMGDLLFAQSHPWLGHGHPATWVQILEQIEQMSIAIAVPGHGPIGTLADCALVRQYIATIQQLVADVVQRGGSEEEAKSVTMPAPFDTWDDADTVAWNTLFLYQQLTESHAN